MLYFRISDMTGKVVLIFINRRCHMGKYSEFNDEEFFQTKE